MSERNSRFKKLAKGVFTMMAVLMFSVPAAQAACTFTITAPANLAGTIFIQNCSVTVNGTAVPLGGGAQAGTITITLNNSTSAPLTTQVQLSDTGVLTVDGVPTTFTVTGTSANGAVPAQQVKKPDLAQVKKPDLACSVAAYKDKARTQAIANGDSVTFAGLSPKVYFVVTAQNVGDADIARDYRQPSWPPYVYVQSVKSRVEYKFNNQVVGNPTFKNSFPMPVGQVPRTVSVMAMPVPAGNTTMEVSGNVDSENQIDEKDKANNQCQLTITTKHMVRQQQPASPAQIKERGKASDLPASVTPRR